MAINFQESLKRFKDLFPGKETLLYDDDNIISIRFPGWTGVNLYPDKLSCSKIHVRPYGPINLDDPELISKLHEGFGGMCIHLLYSHYVNKTSKKLENWKLASAYKSVYSSTHLSYKDTGVANYEIIFADPFEWSEE